MNGPQPNAYNEDIAHMALLWNHGAIYLKSLHLLKKLV